MRHSNPAFIMISAKLITNSPIFGNIGYYISNTSIVKKLTAYYFCRRIIAGVHSSANEG